MTRTDSTSQTATYTYQRLKALARHYWGGLERSWNGYLLDSVDTVLKRAANFIWRSVQPTVTLMTGLYEKGITLCREEKAALEERLLRDEQLPKWDITIKPLTVH